MKKLLLGLLLLMTTVSFGSGYVSTEYEAYEYQNSDSNFQRMETFVGVNAFGGTIELRNRDVYNGANNFRLRATKNLTDQFSVRYQYYTASDEKADHRLQLRYKPVITNDVNGLSHWLILDINKGESESVYTGAQMWTYYTIPQSIIPSLTVNNETYISKLSATEGTLNVDVWTDATLFKYEYKGFTFRTVARAYNWLDMGMEDKEFVHNYGFRGYAYINKDIVIADETIETTLEYHIDYNETNKRSYQYVALKGLYRF